jgi:hypothetical protein
MNNTHQHKFCIWKLPFLFWIIYASCFRGTVFSQTIGNTVSFYVGPGIASTLSFQESKFDKKYFHSFSPYFSLAAELQYNQKLNNYMSLNAGAGLSLIKFSFYHTNYFASFTNEMIYTERSCIKINVPVGFGYKISSSRNPSEIYWTGGCEIEFIHPYGVSAGVKGGGAASAILSDTNLYLFEINIGLRTGIEVYHPFKKEYINLYGYFSYELFPVQPLTISNSSTDLGENQTFYGELMPGQIAFYFGFIFELGKNKD